MPQVTQSSPEVITILHYPLVIRDTKPPFRPGKPGRPTRYTNSLFVTARAASLYEYRCVKREARNARGYDLNENIHCNRVRAQHASLKRVSSHTHI